MNGILNVLKPPGMTSFDVVAYIRGIIKTKKIGHLGTLDPAAAGVLPVFMGSATKAISFMIENKKSYRTELILGISTDTQDSTGSILAVKDVTACKEEISNAIYSFKGIYRQTPPMYSAVKVDGKRLYELARKGITVERSSRNVEINFIDILCIEEGKLKIIDSEKRIVRVIFDVSCSKGTYIRTLCADIGEKLGCGGHMSFLVRTSVEKFDIFSSLTIQEVEEAYRLGKLDGYLIEVDKVLDHYKAYTVSLPEEKKIMNGASIKLYNEGFMPGENVRIYSKNKRFIAIGEVIARSEHLLLKAKKIFD